jgi:hypothetical protein
VDANFARLLKALDDRKLTDNTVVIFMTDNGPGGVRFNAGLRDRKGTVYEGGIRVPCYVRWPAGGVQAKAVIETPLAHIDWTPTLIEACGVHLPNDKPSFDGQNFLPLLTGKSGNWSDRTLFFQWHRGDVPEKGRAFAARGPRYKLVQANGVGEREMWRPKYVLVDLMDDPFETEDLAASKPEEVAKLKAEYDAWFADVTSKGFDPPRIVIGNEKENPVRLSRQDWRGPKAGWAADSEGHWVVTVERAGRYRVTVRSRTDFNSYSVWFGDNPNGPGTFGGVSAPGKMRLRSSDVTLDKGNTEVHGTLKLAGNSRGPDYIELEYLGPPEKK